ncbi:MAG: hypothetical protein HY905_08620 [Deltaproteobacteria bacterium]|nr:hypothetical protein [Deltaproteobacteria bacterium]
MRSSMTWIVTASLVACGGRESDTTPESAAAAAQSEPTQGVRPCDGFVEEGLRCAAEVAAATGLDENPAGSRSVEERLRDDCRGWLESGATGTDLDAAVAGCGTVSCSESPAPWYSCVVQAVPAAAVAPAWTPSPAEWERIDPRPIPPDVPPCAVFTDWVVACVTEAVGEPGFAAETAAAMREGFAMTCDAWKQAGLDATMGAAIRSCADVACGEGGADLSTCIVTRITEAVTRQTGGAP